MIWVAHDTSVLNLTHQKRTIHRCFHPSAHNSYSKVAMVTILGACLGLFAVIRGAYTYFHLQDGFTALMIACNQQLIVRCFEVASEDFGVKLPTNKVTKIVA